MGNEQDLTVSLEEFGLSKYEARAYVTLISLGTASASELSYYSEVPRTKVYPVLLKLQKKRLVIISKSKPIMCTATAPEDAFDNVIQEQINKVNAMNTLVMNLKHVSEKSKKNRGTEEKRYFHLSSSHVLSQLKLMIGGSVSSIKIMVDGFGFSLLSECREEILTILRRNVNVKIIIPPSVIDSEEFPTIPNECEVKISEIIQNCFIFDESELLLIDTNNGTGAIFSSDEVLGTNEEKIFDKIWQTALSTEILDEMTRKEAQEVYQIISIIKNNGLNFIINSRLGTIDMNSSLLNLLEKNGINFKNKTFDEVLAIINSTLQVTCSGNANYDAHHKNIIINSKLNSGHSLPWAMILKDYLGAVGYKTKMIYQNHPNRGEQVHISINSKLTKPKTRR